MFIIVEEANDRDQPTFYIKDTHTGLYVGEIYGDVVDSYTVDTVEQFTELFNI